MPQNESYATRLAQLRAFAERTPSASLRSLYTTAADMTELAAQQADELVRVIGDYMPALLERIAYVREAHAQKVERAGRELEDAQARLATADDPSERALIATNVKILMTDLELSATTLKFTQLFQDNDRLQVTSALKLAQALFDDIYAPDERRFQLAAAMQAVKLTAGLLFPVVGGMAAAVEALWVVGGARQQQAQKAGKHVAYIEQYIVALKTWHDAAGHSIEHFRQASV
ncbi:hypothetical protein SAMN04487938_2182 [Lysobacter sp. cf310]|nr:hypothetical protein SAMN04487938_2182 [Lysobacter sp. cf310]